MSTILGGRFKLIKPVAQGGTAKVYLAEEVATGKKVAVKVMKKDLPEVQDMIRRFEREAALLATIHHPNVVGLVHFESAPEGLVLLTDWIEGTRLDMLMAPGPLEPKLGLSLMRQLASALAAIHATGVIHRDLKPENIVIAPGDVLKLLDFGIARFTTPTASQFVTAQGKIAGTPSYLSPEQAMAQACDARTDVYTFGVLAYRMLSGRLPLEGKNDYEIMAAHVRTKPKPFEAKGVERRAVDLIMKCLEKKPGDRPRDGAALVDALK